MSRFFLLNAISFTEYPVADIAGNMIPWFDITELEKILHQPVVNQRDLVNMLINTRLVHLTFSKPPQCRVSDTVYIFERKYEEVIKRVLHDTIISYVFTGNFTCAPVDIGKTAIKSNVPFAGQSDAKQNLAPFTCADNGVRFHEHVKPILPIDTKGYDNYCDYAASPFLYYDKDDEQLGLYTILIGDLPVTVMSSSLNAIVVLANQEGITLKPVLGEGETVIFKSPDTVCLHQYAGIHPDRTPYGQITSTELFRLRERGYQYIKLMTGEIYEFSTVFGFVTEPVKYLTREHLNYLANK